MLFSFYHGIQYNLLLHFIDLFNQIEHLRYIRLHIEKHVGQIILLWIILEEHHAILLINAGKDFARFYLAEHKIEV